MVAVTTGSEIDRRYLLGPCIGRGAMGEVFQAEDLRLERLVALKFLRADLADDPGARARFANEARAAARLCHPAAVTVYDGGSWGGIPYLAMECLPGTTLADELKSGPLPEPRVRSIAVDIALALQAAHDLGIVHRDVKPGNILLTADGRAKLADFGIAWSADQMEQTQTGLVVGTPAYLAPERLEGQPADAGTDLYSLGVVLYEAIVGERPFRGDSPVALAHAIHNGERRSLADVRPLTDRRLAEAVDAALSCSATDRPASAGRFVEMITRPMPVAPALVGSAVTPPTGPVGPAAPASRRAPWTAHRRALAGTVAVVVAFVIAAMGLARADDGGHPVMSSPTSVIAPIANTSKTAPLVDVSVQHSDVDP